MKIRICDFETTENHLTGGESLCEVGITDFDVETASIGETRSMLINPGCSIAAVSSAVHQITDNMVKLAQPATAAKLMLMEGMGDDDIFAAHHCEYEQKFFNPIGSRWICTFKVAYDLFPEAPSHALQVLRYWLDLESKGMGQERANPPHRAGPDTYVTAYLLAELLKRQPDIGSMIETSARPILLRRVPITREHRGKRFEEVDDGLLHWFLGLSDITDDLRHTCEHHLELRRKERSDPFA